jgi:hypothetical protein
MSVPIVRDMLMALGVVECTLEALNHSIENSAVEGMMIVPGGVSECHQPHSGAVGVRLNAKNKGIFRAALRHGLVLVPVFCFGETDIMGGKALPNFHVWAHRKLGITYPQLPVGRLFLPIPRRLPLTLIVGQGIAVPVNPEPKPTDVEELRQRYYTQLSHLFEKHKAAAGYPSSTLTLDF